MVLVLVMVMLTTYPQATVADEEVATLITINKTNFVVASVLARDSKRKIDFDFTHQNFPTAKLV